MTTLIEQPQTTDVSFPVADAAIAEMRERYMPLKIVGVNDKAGYAMVRQARLEVKNKRCDVENRRKELKADALEWGRKVDAEAKRLTAMLAPIEEHLESQEKAHDAEKDRIKREAAEAARHKLQSRVDLMNEFRAPINLATLSAMPDDDFEAALQAAMRADERRREIEAEQKAEADKIEAARVAKAKEEAAREEAEAAERRKAEDARLAEAREAQRIENERLAAERAELDRQRHMQAEREAAIRSAEQRAAQEAAEKRRAERAEAERLRLEAMRPDREKLMGVVAAIRSIEIPDVSDDAKAVAEIVRGGLERSAGIIESAIINALGEQ